MKLSKELKNKIADVTSSAAISCYAHLGKENKIAAINAFMFFLPKYKKSN